LCRRWAADTLGCPVFSRAENLARAGFLRLVDHLLPALRRLERVLRPRMACLAGDWANVLVGLTCLVLPIIITLPIPWGTLYPALRFQCSHWDCSGGDGVAVTLGLFVAILGLVLVTIASAGLAAGLRHWLWQA
jgi:hypothetical protein